jgi:hypothetical protein
MLAAPALIDRSMTNIFVPNSFLYLQIMSGKEGTARLNNFFAIPEIRTKDPHFMRVKKN